LVAHVDAGVLLIARSRGGFTWTFRRWSHVGLDGMSTVPAVSIFVGSTNHVINTAGRRCHSKHNSD
jgi:hypothetical protein